MAFSSQNRNPPGIPGFSKALILDERQLPRSFARDLDDARLTEHHEVWNARRVHVVVATVKHGERRLGDSLAKSDPDGARQHRHSLGARVRMRRNARPRGHFEPHREDPRPLRIAFEDRHSRAARKRRRSWAPGDRCRGPLHCVFWRCSHGRGAAGDDRYDDESREQAHATESIPAHIHGSAIGALLPVRSVPFGRFVKDGSSTFGPESNSKRHRSAPGDARSILAS